MMDAGGVVRVRANRKRQKRLREDQSGGGNVATVRKCRVVERFCSSCYLSLMNHLRRGPSMYEVPVVVPRFTHEDDDVGVRWTRVRGEMVFRRGGVDILQGTAGVGGQVVQVPCRMHVVGWRWGWWR